MSSKEIEHAQSPRQAYLWEQSTKVTGYASAMLQNETIFLTAPKELWYVRPYQKDGQESFKALDCAQTSRATHTSDGNQAIHNKAPTESFILSSSSTCCRTLRAVAMDGWRGW